jgi:uncharacterized protein
MPEQPFFFPDGSEDLFGVLHEPAQPAAQLPFVLCHPFGEEKLWAHRVFVSFARELARRGHPVLRFDYRGNGDSSSAFADSSVETNLADIDRAIDMLQARTGSQRVGLLGLRFGATLAAEIAERRGDVDRIALWAPIVNGDRYMQDLLRINLTTQMAAYREIRQDREALVREIDAGGTANVDGYEVSRPMFEQVSALKLAGAPRSFTGGCLIVQVERAASARVSPELRQLESRFANASLTLVQEDPFWKEIERFYDTAPNLFTTTLEWLSRPESPARDGSPHSAPCGVGVADTALTA